MKSTLMSADGDGAALLLLLLPLTTSAANAGTTPSVYWAHEANWLPWNDRSATKGARVHAVTTHRDASSTMATRRTAKK